MFGVRGNQRCDLRHHAPGQRVKAAPAITADYSFQQILWRGAMKMIREVNRPAERAVNDGKSPCTMSGESRRLVQKSGADPVLPQPRPL